MTGKRPGKLRNKITAGMLLLSFFPLVIYVFYAFKNANYLTAVAVSEGQDLISRTVQALQKENLENQARLAEKEFGQVAGTVSYLRAAAEDIFNCPQKYRPVPDATPLCREPQGFWWTPAGSGLDYSNVFISSRLNPTSEHLSELWQTKYLEPFFIHAAGENSNIVAAYYISKESMTRIYPKLNFDKMVESRIFPADMDPYSFNFFYTADPDHNPKREVVWTEPYLDVTDRGYMVTCLAPVYPAGGTFKGIVGVDVTLENITSGILNNIHFEQPGAYALLIDSRGEVIAAQSKVYREYADPELRRAFKSITAGSRGMTQLQIDGVENYLFLMPLSINGWNMVFVIPVSQVLYPIQVQVQQKIKTQLQGLIRRDVITGLIMILLVLPVAYFISRHITQPIQELTSAAEALSRGETTQIPVRRSDEIGILASTFNSMAIKITSLLSGLEEKVHQRTQQLEKANQRLLAVNKKIHAMEGARRALIANISHELRGPLASIQCYVEALQDGVAQEEITAKQYLDIIHKKTINLNSLINDLFLLSRLEASLPINVYTYDASAMLLEFVAKLKPDLESAGLKVVVEIDPDLPHVLVDPTRIDQVLANLATNAVKFTAPGDCVVFRARTVEKEVVVEVSDSGVGIAPEDLPHIFERFYRGKVPPCRPAGSHGLGLAIVKEIVEAQGGRVWVESLKGQGSSFFFTLKISDI